jgi:zeaxanthin glucosyltransferase
MFFNDRAADRQSHAHTLRLGRVECVEEPLDLPRLQSDAEVLHANCGCRPARPTVSKIQGEDALQFTAHVVLAQTEAMLKSLPAMVQANGVDALVLDTGQRYAELGAMQLGMPYVHVLYGWPHEKTPAARNREGVAKVVRLLQSSNASIRAHVEKAGLRIDWENPSYTLSPLAAITQVPRAFDFESSHWPPQFHHTGPFHDGKGRRTSISPGSD